MALSSDTRIKFLLGHIGFSVISKVIHGLSLLVFWCLIHSWDHEFGTPVHALEILLPFIPNSVLCPVTALTNYFCTVPTLANSPLFIANHGGSFRPMLTTHFNCFFKACITAVSLKKPDNFSSRSFRQGGATLAFNCSMPTKFTCAQGDWRSNVKFRLP